MTIKETVQIMAMLQAFYGMGKGNPEVMAEGWYLILEPYEFELAQKAVLTYAKNDTREYGTFPTVGNIVKEIENEMAKEQAPINEIVRAVSYGWGYEQLSAEAKQLIGYTKYNDWLKMDAEEFANKAGTFAGTLKTSRKRLLNESNDTTR